jgi:hypothetical protein
MNKVTEYFNRNKSTAYITLGLVLILFVGGGVYAWMSMQNDTDQPPQNGTVTEENGNDSEIDIDTSTWETYRNEEFGFEFQYPEELELSESPTIRPEFEFYTVKAVSLFSNSRPAGFSVQIFDNRNQKSLYEFIDFLRNDMQTQPVTITINREYSISDASGNEYTAFDTEFSFPDYPELNKTVIYIHRDNRFFLIPKFLDSFDKKAMRESFRLF